MNPTDIDYEAKIIIPTRELYQELSEQAGELFTLAKSSALELHAKVSESGQEFYNNPVETATRWQAEATDKGNELYALINDDIIPAAQADYQHIVSIAIDYGSQSREAFQVFLDNPEAVTVEAFTNFNQGLTTFLDQSMNVSAIALHEITSKADQIINLLLEQPIQTVENLYYETLSLLLNSYFDVVSSLISSL